MERGRESSPYTELLQRHTTIRIVQPVHNCCDKPPLRAAAKLGVARYACWDGLLTLEMNMETLKAIATRRSIRRYQKTPIDVETLATLLKAAMQAPSAMNQQPWHFVVIDDRKTCDRIAAQHPHAEMCAEAPLVIIVCADVSTLSAPDHWPQDCAAASQNLLLAAHDLGLGAVWSAIYPSAVQVALFQKLLRVPEHVVPFCVVPVGYPAEEKAPEDRYSTGRVHHNQW